MNNECREAGRKYVEAGHNVIPVNDRKKPAIRTWKEYQNGARSTIEDIEEWSKFPGVYGWAVVCGEPSGGLIVFDFDTENFFEKWGAIVGDIAKTIPVQAWVRCNLPLRNEKLAFANINGEPKLAIETRANGGYAVVAPSFCPQAEKDGKKHKQPYRVIQGDFTNIPILSDEEVEELYKAARELDECGNKHKGNGIGDAPKSAVKLSSKDPLHPNPSDYSPYAQKALENELTILARAPEGSRNDQLNQSSFALGQLLGAGVLDHGAVEAALSGVAASIGLTGGEIRATIRSGIEAGMKQPRQLPEKQSKGRKQKRKQKKTVPPLIENLDIAAIYAQETGLKLLTDPPQADREGFTQCSVLYNPEDPGRTTFVNIGQGAKRGYYLEMKDGKAVIGGNLCQTIAAKGSGPYMTPKDVFKYLQKGVGQQGNPPIESAERGQAIPKECGHYYAVVKGCHNLVLIGESEVQEKPLSNFVAQVSDEVTRDDGAKVTKEFIITGYVGDLQLPSVRVPTKDFDAMKWVRQEWGAAASITPTRNNAAHLPNAILNHSRGLGIRRETLYGHTGWRQINGVWRYLHGGGGIGSGEPVAVDLGENLQLYRIPASGGIEAAQASLRFLGIGPWEVMAPLWACVYLAPFSDLLRVDFSLWMYGPTGSLKSTLVALAMAHFGSFTRLTLPGSWFSTVNSLEKLTFILKDTLCPIDDFCPPSNQKESHAMAECAGRIIYQAGNRSARGRLGPDLMARPNYYPRSLIVSTGETLLPGQRQSATARYLGIELDQKKNPIDEARLTAAQGEAHLYSAAMAAYLEDLAPRLDDAQYEIRDLWTGYRTAFQKSSHHSRIPEIQAWLAVGFELGLRFQVSMRAVTEDVSYEMEKQAWRIFKALGEKHSRIIQGDRPTLKFLAVLHELFLQGKIYAKSTTGGPPPRGFGWDSTDLANNAEFVGWTDGEILYLMPETALRVVHESIRRQGDFLALGRNDMLSALAREGFIEPDKKKGKNTQVKWIEGGSKRVIFLPVAKLRHDEVMENEQE